MARPRVTTPAGTKPPINELGTSGALAGGLLGLSAWSDFVDRNEYVPEMIWPTSVQVTIPRMRTDSQLAALMFGVTMPIRRYKWLLDENGAPPDKVERLARNMGLDIKDKEPLPRGRMRDRFRHDEHLRKALGIGLGFGHYFAEQVGFIDEDGLWTMKKLAERMPNTIQQIKVAPDGGLVSIKQQDPKSKEIPVDNLVAYVWEGEGGNWVGKSIYRECYKNWLLKDILLRVDTINHQRAGGVPMPIAPDDASEEEIRELSEIAQRFSVGENAGAGLPPGTKWQQVRASNSNVIDSIRYHDESMARRFLMMVAMLAQGGTTLGSYALGDVFIDFFSMGQEAIANWYRDITQAYFIEDYWDWNYGDTEEQVPLLYYVKDPNTEYSVEDIVNMVEAGVLLVDNELEAFLRTRGKLPKSGTPRENPKTEPTPDPNQPEPTKPSPTAAAAAELESGGGRLAGAPSSVPQPDPETVAEREERRGMMYTLSGMIKGIGDRLNLMSTQPPPTPVTPDLHHTTEVHVPTPEINMPEGAVQVNVEPPQVTVEPAQLPAPVVNVQSPQSRKLLSSRISKDEKTGETIVRYVYEGDE